jgi:hypothetical protein
MKEKIFIAWEFMTKHAPRLVLLVLTKTHVIALFLQIILSFLTIINLDEQSAVLIAHKRLSVNIPDTTKILLFESPLPPFHRL